MPCARSIPWPRCPCAARRPQVGTAHGVTLDSLLTNPDLNPLVGGVHTVVVGDIAAKESGTGCAAAAPTAGALRPSQRPVCGAARATRV